MIRLLFLIILTFVIHCIETIGQKQIKSIGPPSFKYHSDSYPLTSDEEVDLLLMSSINKDSMLKDDEKIYKLTPDVPFRFGYEIEKQIDMINFGSWDLLEDGGRLWRLKIKCPEAYSINLIYNRFELPEGAYLFLYNATKKYVIGALSSNNNKKHGKFATDLIPGEICWIEYYEPKGTHGKGMLEISKIIHGYIDILHHTEEKALKKEDYKELIQQSGSCNRNVNCPEGDDWCREKYSVSRIIDGGHLCTGSLLNNVRQDLTPYYLTANHCFVNRDPDVWVFEFGYMYENCDGGWTLPTFSYSGADIRGNWAFSDFALLELQEQPLSGEDNFPDVFFNGWDRTGDVPNNTACIHHPSGDRMKISIDNDSPVITGYWIPNPPEYDCSIEAQNESHWRVVWNSGTTEPGSSGSPLYTPERRVIGQLHGGCASCENTTGTRARDYFGRFSFSWFGGGTIETSLHHWLDPDDTGVVEVLDGIHMPHNKYGGVFSTNYDINAYDVLRIGSGIHFGTTSPFILNPGYEMNLKAGREIHIRPCTEIKAGSTFHAYIEELSCDDLVRLSDKEEIYRDDCGSSTPKMIERELLVEKNDNNRINRLSIFPNPTTTIVKIKYSISSESNYTIDILNIFSERIKTLKDNVKQKVGNYSLEFDVSALPSGIYFLTLKSDGQAVTKKFAVMR